ncbi:hypothetical protein LshimejAT787_1303210 [Lyophyllum shimeji]|uniref:Uncharacterized protein n=1 Tax=Lyophyllum shimeji TaxID=47721 RepID=A0A9P3UTB7_LYOSH|nr:hypothetical protein LshimejAT787_1303210 [Lyophyllum shimeji]
MAVVTHVTPYFSMDDDSERSSFRSTSSSARTSRSRHLRRKVVQLWKVVTRATRKHERASFVPPDFVLVTSRRRSAIMHHAL